MKNGTFQVAVTGMGTINPLAKDLTSFSKALEEMTIGVDRISAYDATPYSYQVAAEVRDFDAKLYMDRKRAKKYDRFIQFAVAATRFALEDAGLTTEGDWKQEAGVTISSGIGGLQTLLKAMQDFHEVGPEYISPFLIPMVIPDMASGAVSMEFGLKGPNFATVSACATSLHAIIVSAMMIKHGYAKMAVTGGSEALIHPLPIGAFGNMMALSRNNANPKEASNPFDRRRDGFVMGEGAGVLVLEEAEHARQRGARIYGYIAGFGMSGDAFDFSASDPKGEGATRAINQALEVSGVSPSQVDFINAHATATIIGDISEANSLRACFGDLLKNIPIQGTKSLIGHSLGASGANELIAGILETKNGFIHGMPSLTQRDEAFIDLNIPEKTFYQKSSIFLKNAFGFGGHNASVIFKAERD
ncbi:MAG TPA: beta-ketoacyl-ACP synthase II [Thermotogota bacterium]|nr:beta-ketoacyl-ACP synthase II [Thermotogota bacterium]HQQ65626.1 beta-ketoacyl-ACP synthase II [Thermotogota bacterium]